MLKSWSIENFKPIVNSGELKFAPVTVLAGLNSSGKTSLLQSILMIAQTLSNRLLDRPLLPNGPIVQLGTFEDILHRITGPLTLIVSFELNFESELQDDPLSEDEFDYYSIIEHIGSRARRVNIFMEFNHDATNDVNRSPGDTSASLLKSVSLKIDPEITWTVSSRSSPIEHGEFEFFAKRMSKEDLNVYLKNVSPSYLRLIPYVGEHPNYLGELKRHNRQILVHSLTMLAHFLPMRFIQKFNLRDFYKNQLEDALSRPIYWEIDEMFSLRFPKASQMTPSDILSEISDITAMINRLSTEKAITYDLFVEQVNDLGRRLYILAQVKDKNTTKSLERKLEETIKRKIREIDLEKDDFFEGLETLTDEIDLLTLDQTVNQITRFFTSKIRYLGPLRADPQSSQKFAPSSELDDVGAKGEYAAAVYEANQTAIIDWYNPISKQIEQSTLREALNRWASYLGVADQIMIKSAGYSGFSWQVVHRKGQDPLPLAAVGVGVSQVLPILVMGLLAPKHTLLIIEQPELHLHARVQARLGDFFLGLSKCNKQCLIETHSENLVNQLRYHIVVSGGQEKSDCMIYFVDQDEKGATQFEPVEISPEGNILNWPSGFFDETMHQEDQITAASIRRRGKIAKDG